MKTQEKVIENIRYEIDEAVDRLLLAHGVSKEVIRNMSFSDLDDEINHLVDFAKSYREKQK